jgi:hypothetical protein
LQSYNGGGDRYFTDREMTIALLSNNNLMMNDVPIQAPNPPAIQAKHQLWQWLKSILH